MTITLLSYIITLLAMSTPAQSIPKVLVYTATAGYRHDSIPTAIQVLGDQQASYNVSFTFTEDKGMFTNKTLAGFDGVMFVSNTEEVLDSPGKAALQTFFQSGGVYTGVHSASACLYNDTTYDQAVGAHFDYHPTLQQATFTRTNDTFPATVNVPDRWPFEEEVYNFRSDPRSNGAQVILSVDESSYDHSGSSTGSYPDQGTPHPIAWYIESPKSAQPLIPGAPQAGRSFYTSLGHTNTTWQNSTFQEHVMAGLMWALEGASTKAYGAGLVGNSTESQGASAMSSSTSAPGETSTTTSASASGTTGSAQPSASSGGATQKPLSGGKTMGAAVIGGVMAGVALAL